MIVYLHGSPDKRPVAEHTVIVCPGRHLHGKSDLPSDWYDNTEAQPKPIEFPVKFHYGQAEVDDVLGKYMVAHGFAEKSRLIIPNAWER